MQTLKILSVNIISDRTAYCSIWDYLHGIWEVAAGDFHSKEMSHLICATALQGEEILNSKQIPNPKSENTKKTLTAAEIVNTYSKEGLEKIFREYGEEQFAEKIAGNIIHTRSRKPILKTSDLVEIVSNSVPVWYKKRKIHFATKTFQALRIFVNSELENVENGVSAAIDMLEGGGRLVVISFQGLEDKIVRELFKKKVKEGVVAFVVK